jgi:hypothetical protein
MKSNNIFSSEKGEFIKGSVEKKDELLLDEEFKGKQHLCHSQTKKYMSKCDMGLGKKNDSVAKKDLNKSQDDGISNF